MLDQAGKPVIVGWPEYQLLYLRAAVSLTKRDRWEAYQDIAEMVGRSFASVKRKAEMLQAEDRRESKAMLETILRKNWHSESLQDGSRRSFVSTPTLARQKHNMPPSTLACVSEAAKMGGTANRVKSRAAT